MAQSSLSIVKDQLSMLKEHVTTISLDEQKLALRNIRSRFIDALSCLNLSTELEENLKQEVMHMPIDHMARWLLKHVISETERQDLQKVEVAYRAYCVKEAHVSAVLQREENLRAREGERSRSRHEPAINTTPIASTAIIIETDRIPYRHTITAATPSLLLQLDELSLTVDFVGGGVSGHLIVTQPIRSGVESSGCSIVKVEDIPTDTELQLDRSSGSDRVTISFRKGLKDIICVIFVWDISSA